MARVVRKPGPNMSPEKLKVILDGLDGKRGKVGFFESSKYEDGTPVAYVAAIQEFGSPRNSIPPRPFMRPTIKNNKEEWARISAAGSKSALSGKTTIGNVLEAICLRAVGDIQKTISEIQTPPLKPATIAARARKRASGQASAKPLIDTRLMFDSVQSVVEDA